MNEVGGVEELKELKNWINTSLTKPELWGDENIRNEKQMNEDQNE